MCGIAEILNPKVSDSVHESRFDFTRRPAHHTGCNTFRKTRFHELELNRPDCIPGSTFVGEQEDRVRRRKEPALGGIIGGFSGDVTVPAATAPADGPEPGF